MSEIIIEQWKLISGYNNYLISNIGNVISLDKMKMLKPGLNRHGYQHIRLCKNGKSKTYLSHRLIAITFLCNPLNKSSVDHINNNKNDNRLCNLRFVTPIENAQNSSISKRSTTKVKGVFYHKAQNRFCTNITINGRRVHIGYFDTVKEAKEARMKKANELFGEFVNSCEKL